MREESEMGYVLRNGKRYYQDENGNLSLDNVSQEEADRRERRNTSPGHNVVPWGSIILMVVVSALVGAFFYNQRHISLAEKAIIEYMENVSGSGGRYYESDEVEPTTEYGENGQSYLLPDSAERYLTDSEIVNFSRDEIQLMINEIYARHGREFHSQNNADYFSNRDWYNPIPGKTDEEIVQEFNIYEKANVNLLRKHL